MFSAGQAGFFIRSAAEKIEFPQTRYIHEVYRLFSVLDKRLSDHEWLAADEYTIAGPHVSPLPPCGCCLSLEFLCTLNLHACVFSLAYYSLCFRDDVVVPFE
jgi:glutathione S-transferase